MKFWAKLFWMSRFSLAFQPRSRSGAVVPVCPCSQRTPCPPGRTLGWGSWWRSSSRTEWSLLRSERLCSWRRAVGQKKKKKSHTVCVLIGLKVKRKHPWYESSVSISMLAVVICVPVCWRPLRLSGHTAPSCVCSWGCCTELTACVCPWARGRCCQRGWPQPAAGALWCQSICKNKNNKQKKSASIIYTH